MNMTDPASLAGAMAAERNEPPAVPSAGAVQAVDDYERLVAESPQGSIYCQRWWLDAVAPDSYRILTVRRGQALLAAWPLVTRPVAGRTDVVMPSMTQKLGILYAPTNAKYAEKLSNEHDLAGELIDQLPAGGGFYHQFHEAFTNWLPFHWRGFQQTTRYTYLLTQIKDHDYLWGEMRHKARTIINKGRRNGLKVRDNLEFEELLRLNDLVFERQGMDTPVDRDLLRRMDQACLAHAGRKIFAVGDARHPVHAAAYIVWDDHAAYYLLAGSDPALRGSGALTLAFWEAIQFASTVVDVFDCEGSMIAGVEYAFRYMGARQVPYFAIRKAPPSMGEQHLAGKIRRRLKAVARRIAPRFVK
jgi:hypothetical protein